MSTWSARSPRRQARARARLRAIRLGASLSVLGASASAQVADVDLSSTVYAEPSPTSKLLVLNPTLGISASPASWLSLKAGYEADIVSGASESVKGGRLTNVDVVSSATHFSDTRHVVTGGFTVTRRDTHLSASYSYGTEHDYRSNGFAVSAGTEFLQKNTELELGYGRGFDRVCTTNYRATDPASARLPLDSSAGCFTQAKDRASRRLTLDNFQVGWTQSWTPVLATQLVLSAALQNGFLANPYRAVVIAPGGDQALENHPSNRAHAALSLETKYYARALQTAFSLGLRVYRDTWDVIGETYELDVERYMFPWLRLLVRGRYYNQSGALFWSDDYTGGEPETGPRGQYWTGDRELSPLSSYLLGARLIAARQARPDARLLGAFTGFSATFAFDVLNTRLRSFTWAGKRPDDTLALLGTLGLTAEF